MKKICIISLNEWWVFENKNATILPVEAIKGALKAELGITSYEYSSFTELVIEIEENQLSQVKGVVEKCLKDSYACDTDKVVKIYLHKEAPKSSFEDNTTTSKEGNSDMSTDLEKALSSTFGTGAKTSTPKEAPAPQPEEEKVDPVKAVLEEIDNLVGAREFKALCHELASVAPQIRKSNMLDSFIHNSYVFAINDGAGCTTFLNLFARLLCALELRSEGRGGVNVFELGYMTADTAKFFQEYEEYKAKLKSGKPVICIDISDMMTKVNTSAFKHFVTALEKDGLATKTTFIFKVPFVKKEVLDEVTYALNDVINVKAVCFPPLSTKEICEYASKETERYGFKFDDEAWPSFQERICEEKADGKFYDLKTVNKIVRELIYNKHLDNAINNKDDVKINASDTEKLCVYKPLDDASVDELFDALVCGETFKKKINEIVSQVLVARKTSGAKAPCIHMRFVGNPGTGKTTLARIVGKVLKEKGILRIGAFHECSGRDLVGRFVGETAPKTASICRDAYGSVLFIDEAYSLYRGRSDSNDFGREAIDTLIAEMENHRDDLVVIMAGYTDEMNTMIDGNAGLASRIPYTIEFPNFTREQLNTIFVSMLKSTEIKYEKDVLKAAKEYFDSIPDATINSKKFSNGRFVRNLYERTFAKACTRTQINGEDVIVIKKEDFISAQSDAEFLITEKKQSSARIGF